MHKSSEIVIGTIFAFVIGFFCHTMYTDYFEQKILAPQGALRYEIRRALDETKKAVMEMSINITPNKEQMCDRTPPPQRKIRTKLTLKIFFLHYLPKFVFFQNFH